MSQFLDTIDPTLLTHLNDIEISKDGHHFNTPYKAIVHNLACISITGQQSATLLQGQLSCDISNLEKYQSTFGCFCNPKGRIRSFFNLQAVEEGFLLFMSVENSQFFVDEIAKYAAFYQVTIQKKTELAFFGLLNPNQEQLNSLPAELHYLKYSDTHGLVHGQASALKQYWDSLDCAGSSEETWAIMQLLNKIPSIDAYHQEKYLPHDLSLTELGAVDFKKGCYTGQEIIARMQYLGKLKKSLQLVTFSDQPCPAGTPLMVQESIVGEVINALKVKENQSYALAIINNQAITEVITLKNENQPILEVIQQNQPLGADLE